MRISAECDYACRALLELSLHWPNQEPMQINKISRKQNIPLRYLVQILIKLKKVGFVKSSRGKDGGYNLTKSPEKIDLGELMRKMSGPIVSFPDSAKKDSTVFTTIWEEMEKAISKKLNTINFSDISKKVKLKKGVLNYQI
jgi:Rrf2 family protein